jgi:hypothetical protein
MVVSKGMIGTDYRERGRGGREGAGERGRIGEGKEKEEEGEEKEKED